MKVFWLVFLLHLVNKTAYGIPISAAESNAPREDDAPAQQDVMKNEGEKRFKRSCSVVPFDVQCHGHCPYDEYEWNSVRSNSNCSDERVGTTYHCIDPEDESGNPIEACGVPKYCDKGKGPVISFPKGHSKTADIDCDWCPEDYFNPSESIRSDNNSKCPKVRNDCGRHGLIECDIVTGEKRHWTDSKCECDIKNNYFPLEGENKCTGQSINCVWNQPCKKSLEGFDQIHIYSMSEGKYVCQRGCKEGFEFKTSQSTECEPVQVEINSTRFENGTRIYSSSTTLLVSTTTTGSYTTTTTGTKPNKTAEIVNDAAKAGNKLRAIVICGIIFGILGSLAIVYLCIGCCKYRNKITSGATDDHKGRYNIINREKVSAWGYILCWPCYKVDLPSAGDNFELIVDLPPAGESVVPPVYLPPADENVVPQDDLPPDDENVVQQVYLPPADENVVQQDELPPADENGQQVDGQHNLTTGSDEPKESLPHIEDNPAIGNEAIVDVKMPTSEENQPQRRNMEQQDSTEYSGGNSSSRSETESQGLRPPAADGRSSINKVKGPQENQPDAIVSTLYPQGKQSWIDKLPNDLKQIKVSKFIRLADFIGYGWEALAKQIGLSMVDINQIQDDNKKMFAKKDAMINKYEQKSDTGSLEGFLHLMRRCSQSTEIQWKGLEEYIYRIYDEYCQN